MYAPTVTIPGTLSKCNCNTGFDVAVPVPGQIIVDKVTDPATDTTSFDFTLTGTPTGEGAITPQLFSLTGASTPWSGSYPAGSYSVIETANAAFSSEAVCSDGSPADAIDLQPGEIVTCTFTNTWRAGSLQLVKSVVNKSGTPAAATNWTLTATPGSGAGVVDPSEDLTEPGGFGPVDVYPGDYSLSETGSVTGYTNGTTWSCEGGTLDGSVVTVGPAEDVVCTITNTAAAPMLTLVKEVDNTAAGSLGAEAGNWTLSATKGEENISGVSGAAAVTDATVDEGTYTLSETGEPDAIAGYDWTDLTCVRADGTPEGTLIDGVGVATPSVTLAIGDDITCTFTNTAQRGSVAWTKVDAGTTNPLAGSVRTLTGPGHEAGTEVTDCKAASPADCTGLLDRDPDAGEFVLEGLTWGLYTLVEKSAPPGYIVDTTPRPFEVNGGNVGAAIVIGPFENVLVTPPTIPLTGGVGRDFYTFAGLLVLALGVGMGSRRFTGRTGVAVTP